MACTLAVAAILGILSSRAEIRIEYPEQFDTVRSAKVFFIGSSLTATALPLDEPERGLLGDSRPAAILSIDGMPEELSTRLLGEVLDLGAETVFLEINSYAHEYIDLRKPLVVSLLGFQVRRIGDRLAADFKALFHIGPSPKRVLRVGPRDVTRSLEPEKLNPDDFYRFNRIEPSHGDELRVQLARAGEMGVEVYFFSPPRPRAAVDKMGADEYSRLLEHVERLAADYGVALWHPPGAWPNDHFMDILAHANERGRQRFQRELSGWYRERR